MQEQNNAKVTVTSECEAYCHECKRLIILQEGEEVPFCCGKRMEVDE